MKDRTLYAVQNHIRAMSNNDSTEFDVGIHNTKTGEFFKRIWKRSEFTQDKINWLKRKNASGENIHVRISPGGNRLVFLDDLEGLDIEQMKSDGLKPAALVETSHKNFQAWLKLDRDVDNQVLTEIHKILTEKYDADKGAAFSGHFGRLAGFTNRKDEYIGPRGYPFVLLRESRGVDCGKSQDLIDEANQNIENRKSLNINNFIESEFQKNQNISDPGQLYESIKKAYIEKVKTEDLNRIDWAFANVLYRSYRDYQKVAEALVKYSSELQERKRGHVNEYAVRTAIKAEEYQNQFGGQNYMQASHTLSQVVSERMQQIKIEGLPNLIEKDDQKPT